MEEGYLPRTIDPVLERMFRGNPAVVLEGARSTGKTTTALRRAQTVFRLDDYNVLQQVIGNPELLLQAAEPVLVDEWQRYPEVWDLIRRAVDADSHPGRFILTGSAAPAAGATTHNGAGRFVDLKLRPMALSERGIVQPQITLEQLLTGSFTADMYHETDFRQEDYLEEIIRSGFPDINRLDLEDVYDRLDTYLQRILQTDLDETGYQVKSPETLRGWLTAYAAFTGTDASYQEILDCATPQQPNKPSRATTSRYREALARLWILDPVQHISLPGKTITSRLKQGVVHHLVDPALAARLLNYDLEQLLAPETGQMRGRLFESFAGLSIKAAATRVRANVGHLRTAAGRHEIDYVVQARGNKYVALEVKLAYTVKDEDVQHLLWFKEKLGAACKALVVLCTGPRAYIRKDGVIVLPLALFG